MFTSNVRATATSLTASAAVLAVLVSGAASAGAATAPPFTVKQLSAPGGGVAIDNSGDVLTLNVESFENDTYLVPHGATARRLLGDSSTSSVTATALNVHGVSVGSYTSGGLFQHGATWTKAGVVHDVPTYPGATFDDAARLTDPLDINDSGALVGTAYDPSTQTEVATRWSATGVPTRIDPAGSGVYVSAIDNQGVVAGRVANRAALFGPTTQVRPLAKLAGETLSQATGITDGGVAFGYSTRTTATGSVTTPVVWSSTGAVTRLTRPANTVSAAVAAGNLHGVLVGTATTSNGNTVAVEWTSPTHPVVLPTLAAATSPSLYQAASINDQGVITGSTVRSPGVGGYLVPLVWTPAPKS